MPNPEDEHLGIANLIEDHFAASGRAGLLQLKRLQRFERQQRGTRRWISIKRMAELYAEHNDSIEGFFNHFVEAFRAGEFKQVGRSMLLMFRMPLTGADRTSKTDPASKRFTYRLTSSWLRDFFDSHPNSTVSLNLIVGRQVLIHGWIPQNLAKRFLSGLHIDAPAFWFPPMPNGQEQSDLPKAPVENVQKNVMDVDESCPVKRSDFNHSGDILRPVTAWAKWKYREGALPPRQKILEDFRADYGPVPGVSEQLIREVRKQLASADAKRGGAPQHRAR